MSAPKTGTPSCQLRHVGAAVTGVLHVVTEDGSETDISGGDAYEIPPGHDAWVVGDGPWEAVEFASARTFGATEESGVRALGTILMADIVDSTATLAMHSGHTLLRWSDGSVLYVISLHGYCALNRQIAQTLADAVDLVSPP